MFKFALVLNKKQIKHFIVQVCSNYQEINVTFNFPLNLIVSFTSALADKYYAEWF